MLSNTLMQFSFVGWVVFPPCYLTRGRSMVELLNIVASFKRSQARTVACSAPNPAAGHHQPTSLLETPGHSEASLGQSLVGHCSFLLGPGAQGSVCALQEYFPALCKRAYVCHSPLKDFTPFSNLFLKTLLSSTKKRAKFRS